MKKQNGNNPLVGAVFSSLMVLVLTFAAGNTVNYYLDSSFQALVDMVRVISAIALVISIIWMILVHNQQPQPKIVNKCPHCGAKVSMYSDVCWKCNKPLKEEMEVKSTQSSAAAVQAPQQTAVETPRNVVDSNMVAETSKISVDAEENQFYEVYFKGLTDSKKIIKVIQVVREVVGLSLADGKQFVENPPSLLKSTTSIDEAEEVKGLLESVGAIVEIVEKM